MNRGSVAFAKIKCGTQRGNEWQPICHIWKLSESVLCGVMSLDYCPSSLSPPTWYSHMSAIPLNVHRTAHGFILTSSDVIDSFSFVLFPLALCTALDFILCLRIYMHPLVRNTSFVYVCVLFLLIRVCGLHWFCPHNASVCIRCDVLLQHKGIYFLIIML